MTAWLQLSALNDSHARQWKPKRLRYRLCTIPATLTRGSRRQTRLRYAAHHLWATLLAAVLTTIAVLDRT